MDPATPTAVGDSDTELRLLRNVPALDGLRGLAVLVVVAFHSSLLMPSLRRYVRDGGLGVDAFFVLSGFLITALLLREQATTGRTRFGAFYLRRAMRLLPALVVLLVVHAGYAVLTHIPRNIEQESILSVLFYYTNTPWHRLPIAPGLGALWSLSVEEQFYMVWPVLFFVLTPLRRPLAVVVPSMVTLIAAVAIYRTMLFRDGEPVLLLYTRTLTRADSLLVGALLAQVWVRGWFPKRGLAVAGCVALAWYGYATLHRLSEGFKYQGGYTLIAVAVAVVVLAVLETSWPVNAVLRTVPLRAVGRVSYGLYIWHLFVFQAVLRYGRQWRPGVRLAMGLAGSAAVCGASWFLVEQPFLRWKARLGSRGPSAPPAPKRGRKKVKLSLSV